jgi:shikimate kinase
MIFALIGPRGGGKTTIAGRLSDLTGWPTLSTDDTVEKQAGKSIAELVAAQGWDKFRIIEREAVADTIAEAERICPEGKGVFLDLGGGAILDEDSRRLVRDRAMIVYLHANPEVLVRRIAGSDTRPNLTGLSDAGAEMKKVFAERDPIYLALADLELDTEEFGTEAIVTVLMNWVTARCGVCEF